MRAWWPMGLVLGALLSGCAGEGPATGPESALPNGSVAEAGRTSASQADTEFSGIMTGVTTVSAAGNVQTDYFFEGDHQALVEDGATELRVLAELTGATPAEWQMCVTQGAPHDGVCVVGSSPMEALVNGTALADGGWSVWFFLPDGPVPAGAGAAVEIRWTATVLYA